MAIPEFRDYYYLTDDIKRALSFVEYFNEHESIAIMLGFDPKLASLIEFMKY